jgi:tRNA uridine 5-carbamoylmethylation protein Kti12
VVLIYLPGLPYVGEGSSTEEREQLQRHLIYVALSRPMDYLQIFLSGESLPKELEDLRSLVSGDGEE